MQKTILCRIGIDAGFCGLLLVGGSQVCLALQFCLGCCGIGSSGSLHSGHTHLSKHLHHLLRIGIVHTGHLHHVFHFCRTVCILACHHLLHHGKHLLVLCLELTVLRHGGLGLVFFGVGSSFGSILRLHGFSGSRRQVGVCRHNLLHRHSLEHAAHFLFVSLLLSFALHVEARHLGFVLASRGQSFFLAPVFGIFALLANCLCLLQDIKLRKLFFFIKVNVCLATTGVEIQIRFTTTIVKCGILFTTFVVVRILHPTQLQLIFEALCAYLKIPEHPLAFLSLLVLDGCHRKDLLVIQIPQIGTLADVVFERLYFVIANKPVLLVFLERRLNIFFGARFAQNLLRLNI